ncbi:UNVERIFIED_CONTAM: hypothetical protein FKN15_008295 [Acipenser sinensis]
MSLTISCSGTRTYSVQSSVLEDKGLLGKSQYDRDHLLLTLRAEVHYHSPR